MTDTHSHIYLEEFDADRDDVMKRALAAGVSHIVLPNVDLNTIEPMYRLHESYKHCTSMAMGLHPTEVKADWQEQLARVERHLSDYPFVAIGEVGIDLYWDATYRQEQKEVLATQVQWALNRNMALIIHCREGLDDVLSVFARFSNLPTTVMHSFCGTVDDVRRCRRLGDFYFGINGIVTFKKSAIPAILPEIGIDRIVLETDSPYLAPVPNRGKRNESSNIPHICRCVAQHLGISVEEAEAITDRNAAALFQLQPSSTPLNNEPRPGTISCGQA